MPFPSVSDFPPCLKHDALLQVWYEADTRWSYLTQEKLSRYPEAKIELKAPSISGYILMSKEPVEELKVRISHPLCPVSSANIAPSYH